MTVPLPGASARSPRDPAGWPVAGFALVWAALIVVPILGLLAWSVLDVQGFRLVLEPTLESYEQIFAYGRWNVALRTLRIAAIVAAIELCVAFPFALWLAKGTRSSLVQVLTLAALAVPFFLSLSARTIIWRAILGLEGPVNDTLLTLGVIEQPLDWLLFSEFAVIVGLIGPYFPPMVVPIYLGMLLLRDDLWEASKDLGASPAFTLIHVIVPLTLPAVAVGVVFTFVPLIGDAVIPQLLGGGNVVVLASSVSSLLKVLNYGTAAALSVFMLVTVCAILAVFALLAPRGLRVRNLFRTLGS